jgi:hypothetical protein
MLRCKVCQLSAAGEAHGLELGALCQTPCRFISEILTLGEVHMLELLEIRDIRRGHIREVSAVCEVQALERPAHAQANHGAIREVAAVGDVQAPELWTLREKRRCLVFATFPQHATAFAQSFSPCDDRNDDIRSTAWLTADLKNPNRRRPIRAGSNPISKANGTTLPLNNPSQLK